MHSNIGMEELVAMQRQVDEWYTESCAMLDASHQEYMRRLRMVEVSLTKRAATSPQASFKDAQMGREVKLERAKKGGGDSSGLMGKSHSSSGEPNSSHLGEDEIGMSDSRTGPADSTLDGHGSMMAEADAHWIVVVFKTRSLLYGASFPIRARDYVVVCGDRGEDIGRVSEVCKDKKSLSKGVKEGAGKAVRKALPEEVHKLMGEQREAESQAVTWAQQATRRHALVMEIVDAEYQFDRRKLTFYYDSAQRPDFRALVRELYQRFHARIWMEKAPS